MFSEKNRFIIAVLKALNLFSDGRPAIVAKAGSAALATGFCAQRSELVTGLLISGLLFGDFVFPGDGPKPEAGRLPGLMSGIFISFRIGWV